jgi:transcriptional regulator with XRE-family HTH domain
MGHWILVVLALKFMPPSFHRIGFLFLIPCLFANPLSRAFASQTVIPASEPTNPAVFKEQALAGRVPHMRHVIASRSLGYRHGLRTLFAILKAPEELRASLQRHYQWSSGAILLSPLLRELDGSRRDSLIRWLDKNFGVRVAFDEDGNPQFEGFYRHVFDTHLAGDIGMGAAEVQRTHEQESSNGKTAWVRRDVRQTPLNIQEQLQRAYAARWRINRIARESGLSHATVSQVKNGKQKPTRETEQALESALRRLEQTETPIAPVTDKEHEELVRDIHRARKLKYKQADIARSSRLSAATISGVASRALRLGRESFIVLRKTLDDFLAARSPRSIVRLATEELRAAYRAGLYQWEIAKIVGISVTYVNLVLHDELLLSVPQARKILAMTEREKFFAESPPSTHVPATRNGGEPAPPESKSRRTMPGRTGKFGNPEPAVEYSDALSHEAIEKELEAGHIVYQVPAPVARAFDKTIPAASQALWSIRRDESGKMITASRDEDSFLRVIDMNFHDSTLWGSALPPDESDRLKRGFQEAVEVIARNSLDLSPPFMETLLRTIWECVEVEIRQTHDYVSEMSFNPKAVIVLDRDLLKESHYPFLMAAIIDELRHGLTLAEDAVNTPRSLSLYVLYLYDTSKENLAEVFKNLKLTLQFFHLPPAITQSVLAEVQAALSKSYGVKNWVLDKFFMTVPEDRRDLIRQFAEKFGAVAARALIANRGDIRSRPFNNAA